MQSSNQMQRRLDRITELTQKGYGVKIEWKAFPALIKPDGSRQPIGIKNNPAGFSWIACFFPWYCCAQIREWSYFIVSGTTFMIATLVSIFTEKDISLAANMSISIYYGIAYPYLRFNALQKGCMPYSKLTAAVMGLALSVAVGIPSIILISYYLKE